MGASGGFWARMQALMGGGGSDGVGAAQGPLIPIDRFEIVEPLEPAAAWAENALFKVGFPSGWHDTTPTEPTIEGKPALVVLRRTETTGKPDDVKSRGVIRCFSSDRTTQGEFFAVAEKLADLRARSLGARLVEPLRFVRAGGAPCYTFQVEGKIQIRAFQSVLSAITEVHMFHEGEWLMMQLESDPFFHEKYQKALTTVLGTLTWR
jgi:hypothetical protein